MGRPFAPNLSESGDHVYKIICGRGSHSKNGVGRMKIEMEELLRANGKEFYADMHHGWFLVRFRRIY